MSGDFILTTGTTADDAAVAAAVLERDTGLVCDAEWDEQYGAVIVWVPEMSPSIYDQTRFTVLDALAAATGWPLALLDGPSGEPIATRNLSNTAAA